MLDGVEVIVDRTNAGTTNGVKGAAFFTDVTGRLHAACAAAGVAQLVTLSITGIGCVQGYGYYQAKLAQEQAAFACLSPADCCAAMKFHEFPARLLGRTRFELLAVMPVMRIQRIAARAVGQALLDAEAAPPSARMLVIPGAGVPRRGMADLGRHARLPRGSL